MMMTNCCSLNVNDGARCYKRAAFLICSCNLVAMVFVLYTLFNSTSSSSISVSKLSSSWNRPQGVKSRVETEVEVHLRESYEARRAMEPVDLIKRVKEIQEESIRAEMINAKKIAARLKYAAELSDKLKKLKRASPTKNQKAFEEWQRKKTHAKKNESSTHNHP